MHGGYSSRSRERGLFNLSLTVQLIFLNIFLFLVFYIPSVLFPSFGEWVILNFSLIPSSILLGERLWALITSIFLHGGFFHLFANMFSLFFIGNFLERLVGKKRFFWLYLCSGIFGSLFFVSFSSAFGDLNVSAVGASGALFGLLGVLAVLVPYSKIHLILGPFIIIVLEVLSPELFPEGVASLLSLVFNVLLILMIFSLFSFNSSFRRLALPLELPMWLLPIVAIVPLAIIGLYVDLPIGNSAHFGGLVAGLFYGFYLRKKFPNKTKKIQMYFCGR